VANQQSKNAEQAKMAQEKGETPEQEAKEKTASSRYVPYSKAVYDASADKRRVLYFYATWCPSCKAANEDFTANPNKIPEGVVVIKTNYNDPDTDQEEKDLAKKYGITYQHTFVQIDAQGNQITKWNGGDTDELVANIK
jgi:thiol-disulfide isomerase/thioredoxin